MLTHEEIKAAEAAAKQELRDEAFRCEVERRKAKARAKRSLPWYNRLFPFKIKIERVY